MAKIAIYGGTFNPIHFGHIQVLSWTLANTDIEQLWLMVTPFNPIKTPTPKQTYYQRIENIKKELLQQNNISFSDCQLWLDISNTIKKAIVVSDFENFLPQPNYTINTLENLSKTYPNDTFVLLIGQDSWNHFNKWKRWQDILQTWSIYVYPRHDPTSKVNNGIPEHPNVIFLHHAPYADISSTQIRNRINTPL